MKPFLKTKRMRRLLKQYRMEEKKIAKRDGVWRKPQTKLCSECDPLNCICADNSRASKRIELYRQLSKPLAPTSI